MSAGKFPRATDEERKKGSYLASRSYQGLDFIVGRTSKGNPLVTYHARQAMVYFAWFAVLVFGTWARS